MDFKEVGNIFKDERERRGLSIKEVMEVTKISRRNLLAIEDGNKDELPHPVYAKGFIRSYARFLGLDADELAQVFDVTESVEADALDATDYEVNPRADLAFQDVERRPGNRKNSMFSVAIIIALLALLGGLVYYFGFYQKTAITEQSEAVISSESVVAESAEQPNEDISAERAGATGDVVAAAPDSSDEQSDADSVADKEQKNNSEAVQTASVAAGQSAGGGTLSENTGNNDEFVSGESDVDDADAVKYAHVLVIRATTKQGCWVGVWKSEGNDMARDFFLRNGEPLRLKFNSFRRIRIGNVPGVVVQYNGEEYPLDPGKGKTQDLRFGKL
ncbi:RodZ domain-containing protein [Pseudodesulfovibrio senegalensis]|nr:RodZ domain-containing protein [Pseudodesulfovibrio senegalensis]